MRYWREKSFEEQKQFIADYGTEEKWYQSMTAAKEQRRIKNAAKLQELQEEPTWGKRKMPRQRSRSVRRVAVQMVKFDRKEFEMEEEEEDSVRRVAAQMVKFDKKEFEMEEEEEEEEEELQREEGEEDAEEELEELEEEEEESSQPLALVQHEEAAESAMQAATAIVARRQCHKSIFSSILDANVESEAIDIVGPDGIAASNASNLASYYQGVQDMAQYATQALRDAQGSTRIKYLQQSPPMQPGMHSAMWLAQQQGQQGGSIPSGWKGGWNGGKGGW